ncbi:MAG TPA: protein phosphatase 2C domain-containing protein [Chloroflexota bacterium]|nr:protein phosphatase 2C domain-containing protein [Chloroflexota bacterium]
MSPTVARSSVAIGVFRMPKAGCSQAEYEDAIAWSSRGRRFAVADGASASAFARLWAQLLVRAYVGGHLQAESLETDLAPIQTQWASHVDQRPLAWYAQEQARRGAFAALAGLALHDDASWSALAVGDSCVFHVRNDDLLTAFPLSDTRAFDNRPLLLGSHAESNAGLRNSGAIRHMHGTWQPGDTFLLLSDALAAALLRRMEQYACSPLASLSFKRSPAGFQRWVRNMRAEQRMRNDDVSLLWLGPAASAAA